MHLKEALFSNDIVSSNIIEIKGRYALVWQSYNDLVKKNNGQKVCLGKYGSLEIGPCFLILLSVLSVFCVTVMHLVKHVLPPKLPLDVEIKKCQTSSRHRKCENSRKETWRRKKPFNMEVMFLSAIFNLKHNDSANLSVKMKKKTLHQRHQLLTSMRDSMKRYRIFVCIWDGGCCCSFRSNNEANRRLMLSDSIKRDKLIAS